MSLEALESAPEDVEDFPTGRWTARIDPASIREVAGYQIGSGEAYVWSTGDVSREEMR